MYHHINLLILLTCYGLIIWAIVDQDSKRRVIVGVTGAVAIFVYPVIMELLINLKAKLCKNCDNIESHSKKHKEIFQQVVPICYSDDYNITCFGIEKCHPFDSCKYGRIFQKLVDNNIINKTQIYEPEICSRETLLEVMSGWYLLSLNYSICISKCVELPICFLPSELLRYRLLNSMMRATQGSIDGACMALEHGWAINLSGGYHHATKSSGGGFCIYPDITLAIHHLKKFHFDRVNKVMIIDLDAHQGNGHERDFLEDDSVFIVDCYNHYIYPGDSTAKSAIRNDIAADHRHNDDEYLDLINKHITSSVKKFNPDFILYNAGTDCMVGDPLGNMNISSQGIIMRDEIVFSIALKKKIPILMVLSGGYQKVNAPTIADSIDNLINKFSLIKN